MRLSAPVLSRVFAFALVVGICPAAEFEGALDPFLGEPEMELKQVFDGERFPNINIATDGTVLAVFGNKSVRVRRSEDGGASWGEPIAIADPGFMGGGVTVDEGSGDVLSFVESNHPPAPITVYRSKDHGKTWAAQETTFHPDPKGNLPSMHMNDHGITLRHGEHKGRLVRPSRFYAGKNHRDKWPEHYTNAIYSDDGGTTWKTSAPFPENGTGEACIVELSDGRLLYNSRVHWDARPKFNRRRGAFSSDGGATWGDYHIIDALPDGQQQRSYGCMGGLCRLPVKGEDVLVFSNIDTPNPTRERATVWASFDGGKTWPVKRLVHDGPSGYSSIIAGRPGTKSEGQIYLMFESAGAKVARFNLSWLVAGERTGDGEIPARFKEAADEKAAAAAPEKTVDFARQVLPILSNKCFVCHGPDAKKDELRLDSREAAVADLGGYHAIDPKALEESEIIHRIYDADDPMPPKKAEKSLTDAERELLSRWVKEGGDYAKHWAFVPPTRPEGFDAEDGIDRLIGEALSAEGIKPAPVADKATLARRAALVLTGLPPESKQLATHLADTSPEAYSKFVDQLMEGSRYGEHQARYWLDAVRYGDTHGLHLDNRRGIYPYRDWVVKAFNDNLPFDQFITQQLAGDLLPEPSLEQLVATGFVRMNPSTAEGGAIPAEFQAKNNFDRTEMFGTVMLGMSMSCARCHTHKYDPIIHDEYYGMLAFFNSTAESPMDGNKYEYAPTIKVPASPSAWQAWEAAKAEGAAEKVAELEKAFTTTLVAKELDKPRVTKVLHRGEYDQPQGEPVPPGIPAAMGSMPAGAPANRLGLAQWLVAPENPLFARVTVNRIWQRVFGYGLVRTPEDFGLQGEQPTHPQLLDALAVEFRESGWDLRHMLRLMLTSAAFQQDSRWRDDVNDPENRLYARGPSYRLDAEVLRDTALWASGLLDPTMGGEGVKPYQPAGLWSALMHPGSNTKNYQADKDKRVYRRSLYVYWKRTSPHPMMTLFDAPNRESACVGRTRSSTALQSLGLLNETQRIETARAAAEKLVAGFKDDAARLDTLFGRVACRPPNDVERAACLALLESARGRFSASEPDAIALLETGMAPRNPNLPAAEVAAWTQVVSTVFASDIAISLY